MHFWGATQIRRYWPVIVLVASVVILVKVMT